MGLTGYKNISYEKSRNKYCLEFYNPDGSRKCRFRFDTLNIAVHVKNIIELYGLDFYKDNKEFILQSALQNENKGL